MFWSENLKYNPISNLLVDTEALDIFDVVVDMEVNIFKSVVVLVALLVLVVLVVEKVVVPVVVIEVEEGLSEVLGLKRLAREAVEEVVIEIVIFWFGITVSFDEIVKFIVFEEVVKLVYNVGWLQ